MNKYKIAKDILFTNIFLLVILVGFYLIAGNDLFYTNKEEDKLITQTRIDINTNDVLEQSINLKFNTIEDIKILGYVKKEDNNYLNLKIKNDSGEIIFSKDIDINKFKDGVPYSIKLDKPICNEKRIRLIFTGNNMGLYANEYYDNGRFKLDISSFSDYDNVLTYNGNEKKGNISYKLTGKNYHYLMNYYIVFAVILQLLWGVLSIYFFWGYKHNKNILFIDIIKILLKYKFLIEQMVKRDFKNKYKRSILGIFWSLLNPLFMLAVQYAIFSTLFKSVIDKFPIYLLIGIICFNFASEAIGRCLTSIVDNSYLLFKVYIPKYIFPLSYIISSSINLFLSFILLFIFILFNDININIKFLLLPYGIFCLLFFCLGLGLILATLMVFFRDIQFLWGIINMLWLYLTPIFYPETIIPSEYMELYKLNPLYPIITFFRSIIINGVSPEPAIYIQSFFTAMIFFVIGIVLFKWKEKDFIYYL